MPSLGDRAALAIESALGRAGSALDQGALHLMRRAMSGSHSARRPPSNARDRLLELAAHYQSAEAALFAPPPAPEMVETPRAPRAGAVSVTNLHWPSRYRATYPGYAEELARYGANMVARARLYRGPAPDPGQPARPVVLCLHGWSAGQVWLDERAFAVPYLLRIGLDVALFQLPFHGQRTPVQARRSGALFPSANAVRTNEGFGQAVSDLRALRAWLGAHGAGAMGAFGMSLGAYLASLWARLDADLDFVAVTIPAVSLPKLWWSHGAGSPVRRRAERAGVTVDLLEQVFAVHAPLSSPVLLPRQRLFIAAARGDRITPPAQAEMLWHHWDEPAMLWMTGGHLAQVARGEAFRSIRRWLAGLGLLERRTGCPRSSDRGSASHRGVPPRSLGPTQLPPRALRCSHLHDLTWSGNPFGALR